MKRLLVRQSLFLAGRRCTERNGEEEGPGPHGFPFSQSLESAWQEGTQEPGPPELQKDRRVPAESSLQVKFDMEPPRACKHVGSEMVSQIELIRKLLAGVIKFNVSA